MRNEDLGLATARAEMIRLARRIISAEGELIRNRKGRAALVTASGSAQFLMTADCHGSCRSCGVKVGIGRHAEDRAR